jgi:HEAT repeat protein
VGKAWTRRAIAVFLHEAGGAARPAIDLLIKGLQDEDVEVREWCITALAFMEYLEPFEVVPAVLPLLNDTSDEVVEYAIEILKDFRMAPGSAMECLLKVAAKHPDEFVRSTALEALCAVDPEDVKVRKGCIMP